MARSIARIYEELAPAVLGYFRGHGAADPDDLTGDVFVRVTAGIDRFRGDDAALRRWVFTIAHHRLVDEYRRGARTRETSVGDVPEVPDRAAAAADVLVDPALVAALGRLTPEQRDVVVLRFVADLPLRDVAKVLGKRAGAVKMLQARGLAALADELDEGPTEAP
jgi:RNA polymerase sigma-70 factor (ECF subfamily)